jgi:hypothetical protein
LYQPIRPFLGAFLLGSAFIASAQGEWKAKTHYGAYGLYSVVHAGSGWVAVGIRGVIMTSPDGNDWLNASTEDTKHVGLLAVAWSGKTLVAAGYGEGGANFAKGMLMASENGKAWTEAAITPATLRAVTWGGDRFVATGDGRLHTSVDGTTWISRDTLPRASLGGIAWNGSRFVAVGYGGAILVSSDAETWSEKASPTNSYYKSVTWTGKRWIVVGENGTALHSENGETWIQGKTGVNHWLNSVVWTGSRLVAVGDSGVILVSQDGSVWQPQESGTDQNLYSVAVHGETLIAVGESNTILASTVDVTTIRSPFQDRKSKSGFACRFQGSQMRVHGYDGTRLQIRKGTYAITGNWYSEALSKTALLP